MKTVVFDFSAIIAALAGEPGAERVRQVTTGATISSANLAEVVAFFALRGHGRAVIVGLLAPLKLEVEPLSESLGIDTGLLAPETRHAGLSLGDRACIALAQSCGAQILTADRAWQKLETTLGLDIVLIR